MAKCNVRTEPIGVSTAYQILFLALKLTGCIDWDWWWVLAPTWIPFAVVLFFICLRFVIKVVNWIKECY